MCQKILITKSEFINYINSNKYEIPTKNIYLPATLVANLVNNKGKHLINFVEDIDNYTIRHYLSLDPHNFVGEEPNDYDLSTFGLDHVTNDNNSIYLHCEYPTKIIQYNIPNQIELLTFVPLYEWKNAVNCGLKLIDDALKNNLEQTCFTYDDVYDCLNGVYPNDDARINIENIINKELVTKGYRVLLLGFDLGSIVNISKI